MAANDYYNTYPTAHATPYHDYPNSRHVSPLPRLPSPSPFDDSAAPPYSSHHKQPAQSYSGSNGRINDDADPFDDDNAIPLNGRKPKHESTHTYRLSCRMSKTIPL